MMSDRTFPFSSANRALSRAVASMDGYAHPWWIAGGWAIDLWLGFESRSHQDIDIAVLRRDQDSLRRHLAGWRLTKMTNGVRSDWLERERLELPIHEIHAERGDEHREFLLNEATADRWLFRRNPDVFAELGRVARRTADGIPYLCPEVVLLYKAKSPRRHDRADFESALPSLDIDAKTWLASALRTCHPSHPWIEALRARATS